MDITAAEVQSLSLTDLRRREHLTVRAVLQDKTRVGTGLGAAAFDPSGISTVFSLIATARNADRLDKDKRRLAVLQGEIRRRGLVPYEASGNDKLEAILVPLATDVATKVVSEEIGCSIGGNTGLMVPMRQAQTAAIPDTIAQPTAQLAKTALASSALICRMCGAAVSNDSSHLECLGCIAAGQSTFFCTSCCVTKMALVSHHHPTSNFVSPSDTILRDDTLSAYGWEVRKTGIDVLWHRHKLTKTKTFGRPEVAAPVVQTQDMQPVHYSFLGETKFLVQPNSFTDSDLPPGWEELRNPDGRLFYYHHMTRRSLWNKLALQPPQGYVEMKNPNNQIYNSNSALGFA